LNLPCSSNFTEQLFTSTIGSVNPFSTG
jgi:hypothetical protein